MFEDSQYSDCDDLETGISEEEIMTDRSKRRKISDREYVVITSELSKSIDEAETHVRTALSNERASFYETLEAKIARLESPGSETEVLVY
jgi:hypothetical protein